MKVSVSLPSDVVLYLDEYAHRQGFDSRSAVLQQAVRMLQAAELGAAYEEAWQDGDGDDARLWDAAAGDGLAR